MRWVNLSTAAPVYKMPQTMNPVLLHYISPNDQSYCGSEMVAHQNIGQAIKLNQATLIPLSPWKTWRENTWPVFDLVSQRWNFVARSPQTPLVYSEVCFNSGRDSTMCPTFINFDIKPRPDNTLNPITHFAELIYPNGDRTIKVNSLARLDLQERIHEINGNVGFAWQQWRNCHKNLTNGSNTYKYHSRVDAVLMQMKRVIDDIFVSYFYKQFKNETLDLGFYSVDSYQWLYSDKPFKNWPVVNSPAYDDKKRDELKRRRNLLKRLFVEDNGDLLKILTLANNASKHSYFNTTPRSKVGNDFPTLLINLVKKNGQGKLEEININLSQLILGFSDLLNSIATRAVQINTTGSITEPYSSHCDRHSIEYYELDLPRPA